MRSKQAKHLRRLIRSVSREDVLRCARGSISVLLVMVMVPVIAVAGLFVDASRYQLARSELASIGDLTLNTALADYDHVLKDCYGLFAVSQSNPQALNDHLKSYFDDMISSSSGASSIDEVQNNLLLKNLVNIEAGETTTSLLSMVADEDITFNGVAGSDLGQTAVLKHQIVEFEKYRAPMNAAMSILQGIKALQNTKKQVNVAKKSTEVDDAIQDVNNHGKNLWDAANAYQKADKRGLSEKDSYNGRKYNEYYQQEIVPAALEKGFVSDARGNVSMQVNNTLWTGYNFTFEVPDYDPKVRVGSRDIRANNLSLQVRESDRSALEQLIRQKILDLNPRAGGVIVDKRNIVLNQSYRDLDLNSKLQYHEAYKSYMQEAYLLFQLAYAYKHLDEQAGPTAQESEDEQPQEKFLDKNSSDIFARLDDAYAVHQKFQAWMADAENRFAAADATANAIASDYNGKVASLNELGKKVRDCKDRIDKLREYVKTASDKNENFKKSIDNYNVKDNYSAEMNSTYEANKQLIDMESFNAFEDHINKLYDYVIKVTDYMSNLKMLDGSISGFTSTDAVILKMQHTEDPATHKSYYTALYDRRTESMTTLVSYVTETYAVGTRHEWTECESSLEADDFYKYLKETYGAEKENADEEKELRNNLNDAAKNEANNATGEDAVTNVSSGNISEIIANDAGESNVDKSFKTDNMKKMTSDKDGAGSSDMLSDTSGTLGKILTGAEKALENTRDNLFVMDYAFNMFSWNTQKNEYAQQEKGDPETATGIPLTSENNKFYGAEVEYLIYGIDNVKSNVLAARASIFAIRFACNLVFALTDSGLNAQTLPPAMAIQAATAGIVPYKIPQTVMKIALAVAETAVDMARLNKGEAVPLIKDSSTWSMSIDGAVRAAKGAALDVGGKAINKAAEATTGAINALVDGGVDLTNKKVEGIEQDLTNAVKGQAEAAVGGLFNTFSNSVIEQFNNSTSNFSQGASDVAQKIIDQADAQAKSYIAQQSSGAVHDVLSSAYQSFVQSNVPAIKSEIQNQLQTLKTNADAKASAAIESVQKKVTDAIQKPIQDGVKSVSEKLQGEVTRLGTEAKDKVGQAITTKTAELNNAYTESVNSFFDNHFGDYTGTAGKTGGTKGVSSGFASMLKFRYSDYLKMFFIIGLVTNSDNIVKRIGKLITANIRTAPDAGAYAHAKKGAFDLGKAYTYYEMKASVKLRTMFLAMPVITTKMGVEEVSAFEVDYHGALGY